MQLLAKNMAANKKNTLRNFILKIFLCMLILCGETHKSEKLEIANCLNSEVDLKSKVYIISVEE